MRKHLQAYCPQVFICFRKGVDVISNRNDAAGTAAAAAVFSGIAAFWTGLLIAPLTKGGLPSVIRELPEALKHPFSITLTLQSVRTALLMSLAAVVAVLALFSQGRNHRPGQEHGSASWGSTHSLASRYSSVKGEGKRILTVNVSMGMDTRRHGRNLNVLVVGGSGSGKTRYYALPNVLSMQSSMIVLDPKGESLRMAGKLLQERGFEVRVLDLVDPARSHCYNPFVYLRTDSDIQRLVTNLFENTTPKGSRTQDPFWDQAAQMLLLAVMFYLHHEAPPEEQNFSTVMDMIRAGEVRENDDMFLSPLDEIFERLASRDPDHMALKYYRSYRSGSGKTLKSIQITLMSRLEKFNLESIASMTACDEMELDMVGERKTAVFAVIPDDDSSFNFLVGMLYTQLFQQLYYRADNVHGGRLPVHVHFMMDEFANVALPDQFEKMLSTMRSREISVSMILQNLSQLKALFEKQWESIVGNADTFLYLGGNEQSTYEYVSKLMGKETIDVRSTGKSRGGRTGWSENWQRNGRELMMPDEVRMLDNRYALLFIRGEKPVMDLKYDIRKHPMYRFTPESVTVTSREGPDEGGMITLTAVTVPEQEEERKEDSMDLLIFTEEELEEGFNEIRKRSKKDEE